MDDWYIEALATGGFFAQDPGLKACTSIDLA
jgi:hypothetical protein